MIEPNILQPNLIPIELEDINIQGGMDISATPLANTPITTTPSNIVVSPNGSVINLGSLQSTNFKVGTTGWKLGADGIIRAVGVILSGDIKATTGKIGAFTINATSIYTGTEDHSGYTANAGDLTIYSDGTVASIHGKEFYIGPDGKLTCTSITATGTINAQAGYLASGVYVDTVNGLLCESGGINVGVAGHVRGGATDYNTGTGFFLGYDTDKYKLSVGVSTGYHLNFDGTDLDIVAKSITTGDKTITVSTSDNVQTAINDINSAGGGTVFLQSGTYTLTADLVLYSNITLMGTDPDRCIIDFNGGAYQVKVIGTVGTRKTDILIKNLTIKNSELSDPTYATDYYTIKIDYVDEIMFDNCIIYDTTLDDASREQYLIAVYRCNKIVVENCYFYSNTTASYGIGIISSSGELIVRNSKFEDFGQSANGIAGYGIILWTNGSLDNCIISENTFEDCYNYSVYLQGTTPFVSFINNVCKRTGEAVAGVFTDASAEGSILGNYFKSLTGDGINVNAGEHIIISNNIAVGCNRGVKVSGDNTIIANNIIKDGASHGIEIIGGSDNNIISNNIITNQGGYGVKIETSACDKNIIIANQLVGNTSGAIQDTGTNTEIGHNIES